VGGAVLAAAPGESSAAIEEILAFGISWLDWTRSHVDRHAIEGLRLFIPEGSSRFLRERIFGLSAASPVELFEIREADGRMQKMDTADAGNLESWLVSRGEVESARAEARHAIGRIRTLALHVPPAGNEIRHPAGAGNQPYWLRVRRHQREGDSKRYGYFAGVALDPKQPLVWLVAPGLRFHSATETLLKYLSPETQVTRIGLNENWRRKLKVVFRQ